MLVVAGCGTDGAPAGGPTAAPSSTATSGPDDLTPSPGRGDVRTYEGTVAAGVEAGCRILRTGSGAFVLVGSGVERLSEGARVTVRGTVDPGAVSLCNQGPVLRVAQVVSPTP